MNQGQRSQLSLGQNEFFKYNVCFPPITSITAKPWSKYCCTRNGFLYSWQNSENRLLDEYLWFSYCIQNKQQWKSISNSSIQTWIWKKMSWHPCKSSSPKWQYVTSCKLRIRWWNWMSLRTQMDRCLLQFTIVIIVLFFLSQNIKWSCMCSLLFFWLLGSGSLALQHARRAVDSFTTWGIKNDDEITLNGLKDCVFQKAFSMDKNVSH